MRCTRCRHENPAGAKFCNACGDRLERSYPTCGHGNPPGRRFCNECGGDLVPPPSPASERRPASPQSYTPRHLAERILAEQAALEARGSPDGERKIITALFADIKGSMELIEDLDPEGARRIVDPALTLWLLGYPEQSLRRSQEALALAQGLSHPFSLAFALAFAAFLHQLRRDGQATHAQAEAVMTLAQEQGLPRFAAMGTILRGWALVEHGQPVEGIALIHQGLAAWQTAGQQLGRPHYLALLAEAYGRAGQVEDGLSALEEALAVAHTNGDCVHEAELYRLKGELLLARSTKHQAEAAACFHQALDVARRQQARWWELRAAMSLSRLWQRQGKRHEARQLLEPIYGWFTEGFDTADLQEAKALLEELEGHATVGPSEKGKSRGRRSARVKKVKGEDQ
jgi:tetratricopeptide (TPR) repeat protein